MVLDGVVCWHQLGIQESGVVHWIQLEYDCNCHSKYVSELKRWVSMSSMVVYHFKINTFLQSRVIEILIKEILTALFTWNPLLQLWLDLLAPLHLVTVPTNFIWTPIIWTQVLPFLPFLIICFLLPLLLPPHEHQFFNQQNHVSLNLWWSTCPSHEMHPYFKGLGYAKLNDVLDVRYVCTLYLKSEFDHWQRKWNRHTIPAASVAIKIITLPWQKWRTTKPFYRSSESY